MTHRHCKEKIGFYHLWNLNKYFPTIKWIVLMRRNWQSKDNGGQSTTCIPYLHFGLRAKPPEGLWVVQQVTLDSNQSWKIICETHRWNLTFLLEFSEKFLRYVRKLQSQVFLESSPYFKTTFNSSIETVCLSTKFEPSYHWADRFEFSGRD